MDAGARTQTHVGALGPHPLKCSGDEVRSVTISFKLLLMVNLRKLDSFFFALICTFAQVVQQSLASISNIFNKQ